LQGKITVADANVLLRYLLRDHEELYRRAEGLFGEVFGRICAYGRKSIEAVSFDRGVEGCLEEVI